MLLALKEICRCSNSTFCLYVARYSHCLCKMLRFGSWSVYGWCLYTMASRWPHKKKSEAFRCGDHYIIVLLLITLTSKCSCWYFAPWPAHFYLSASKKNDSNFCLFVLNIISSISIKIKGNKQIKFVDKTTIVCDLLCTFLEENMLSRDACTFYLMFAVPRKALLLKICCNFLNTWLVDVRF